MSATASVADPHEPPPVVAAVGTPTRQEIRPAPPEVALAWVRPNACPDLGPISLTSSDGAGLRLAELDAHAVIEGPLAYTELKLGFDNPEARVLEGRFAIVLPPGVALSRFAVAHGNAWREGEVVERARAQQAYEDSLHRGERPALLEGGGGNRFEARVFPIEAGARQQIVVGWSQALASTAEPYVLPVCGLPRLDRLDVDVLVRRPDERDAALLQRVELHERDYTPALDLELRTDALPAPMLRADDLVVARVVPALTPTDEPLRELAILFDTSASRALDFEGQLSRLAAVLAELARRRPDAHVDVIAFDQAAASIFAGPAAEFGPDALERLRARGPLGASDLAIGLAAVGRASRVLYVGDGVFTAGATSRAAAVAALGEAARAHGIERFDALIDGGVQDRGLLEALTRGELHRDGVVLDARVSPGHLVDRLERATASGLELDVPGASWFWPHRVDGMQAGDALLVWAQLPRDRAFEVRVGDVGVIEAALAVATVPRPLLARAHAAVKLEARLAELAELAALGEDADPTRIEALQREVVALSTGHRVVTDATAMLVLADAAAYARYGLDPTALADVLTVGPTGIELIARGGLPVTADDEPEPEPEAPEPPTRAADPTPTPSGGIPDVRSDDAPPRPAIEPTVPGPIVPGPIVPGPIVPGPIAPGSPVPESPGPKAGDRDPPRKPGKHAPPSRRPEDKGATTRPQMPGRSPPIVTDAPQTDPPPPPADTEELASDAVLPRLDPHDGEFAAIMGLLRAGDRDAALESARAWRSRAPGDVLAVIALGEVLEARGDRSGAARAYGSIIDLFPGRADLRRMAGERLDRLDTEGLALAIDTYAKAVAQRPDHASGHRALAYALLRAGRHEEAFAAILAGLDRSYPGERLAEIESTLREDLGLIAAVWLAIDPAREPSIARAVGEHHASIDHRRSLRFVLVWETDNNDVDLHVYDGAREHAFFGHPELASGGQLHGDVTTGFGPESFVVPGNATAFPYRIEAHYFARGPMGYGMGKLEIIEHDGAGKLHFVEQPFVLMRDGAAIELLELTAAPSTRG